MKVAVLGCGSIGRRHIKNIQSLGHDVVAWNRGEERAQNAAADFRIQTYTDKDALFKNEKPDVAFICTPNSEHVDDSVFAAENNCHLFIEKPLSHTMDDVEKLRDLIKGKNLLTQVGANLRYDFGPLSLYNFVQKDRIGKVLWAGFHGGMSLPDWHPDEDYRDMYSAKKALGGGVVLDFIHEIDLILWFFGTRANIIGHAYHSGVLEIETQDIADMLFIYKDKTVNLHIDYLQKPFQRGIKIIGEKGWCEWSLSQEKIFFYNQNTGNLEEISYPDNYDKNDMYVAQIKDFFTCLKQGKEPDNNLQAGIDALKAALTVHEN